jgi:hypothetical protein
LPARRTNENLAGFFEVTRRTIDNWIATVPEFAPTVRTDRVLADAMVTRGLYTRAGGLRPRGQAYPECRGEKKTVITTLHLPPDTQACVFWLRNRCREHWCDRLEPVTEGTTNWSPCSMPPAEGALCRRRVSVPDAVRWMLADGNQSGSNRGIGVMTPTIRASFAVADGGSQMC